MSEEKELQNTSEEENNEFETKLIELYDTFPERFDLTRDEFIKYLEDDNVNFNLSIDYIDGCTDLVICIDPEDGDKNIYIDLTGNSTHILNCEEYQYVMDKLFNGEVSDWLEENKLGHEDLITLDYDFATGDADIEWAEDDEDDAESATIEINITDEPITESVSIDRQSTLEQFILNDVKDQFELGASSYEDKREFEKINRDDLNLTDEELEFCWNYYNDLINLGPAGFYEEFRDELDFDPDFIAEYSYGDDE